MKFPQMIVVQRRRQTIDRQVSMFAQYYGIPLSALVLGHLTPSIFHLSQMKN